MRHLYRHKKTFGIIPDTKSKEYLKKVLEKLKKSNLRNRQKSTMREIKRIERELKEGPTTNGNDVTEMIRVKLMQNATQVDFENKIGKETNNYLS